MKYPRILRDPLFCAMAEITEPQNIKGSLSREPFEFEICLYTRTYMLCVRVLETSRM